MQDLPQDVQTVAEVAEVVVAAPSLETIVAIVLGGAVAAYALVWGVKGAVAAVYSKRKKKRPAWLKWMWRPISVGIGLGVGMLIAPWPWGAIYGAGGGAFPTLAIWLKDTIKARKPK